MALPEAKERLSHGEPTWFAGTGKVFAMLDDHHHGGPHLSVWLPAGLGAQQALIESDPGRYFRPAYVGGSGWVGVVLDDRPDWAAVAWLVEQAYRLVAIRALWRSCPRRPLGRERNLAVRTVEGAAHGSDPGGPRESHLLEIGAGRAALGAAEPSHGMAARLVVLTKGATYPGDHGVLLVRRELRECRVAGSILAR
jgi:hypothetical protein